MDALTLFGVVAVSAMLAFYALEDRAPLYVLLFAGACLASSCYGFLQGAWPFGIVEGIWTIVALRRWQGRVAVDKGETMQPIACDLSALTATERERYGFLRQRLLAAIADVTSSPTAFQLRLNNSIALTDAAEWMALEHRCCPFLTLRLGLSDAGTRSVEIGGSARIKAFVTEEFGSFVRA
jgi:hypothetical protein